MPPTVDGPSIEDILRCADAPSDGTSTLAVPTWCLPLGRSADAPRLPPSGSSAARPAWQIAALALAAAASTQAAALAFVEAVDMKAQAAATKETDADVDSEQTTPDTDIGSKPVHAQLHKQAEAAGKFAAHCATIS